MSSAGQGVGLKSVPQSDAAHSTVSGVKTPNSGTRWKPELAADGDQTITTARRYGGGSGCRRAARQTQPARAPGPATPESGARSIAVGAEQPQAAACFKVRCRCGQADDPEKKSQGRSVILSAYGINLRANFVSSLRKDCRWEVDAGTTPCGTPGDSTHQRRSLDVESVFW